MIWSVIWYWLLAVFTAADIITTKIGLALGAHEANPILAPVVDHLVEVKFAALIICIVLAYQVEKSHPEKSWIPIAAGACMTFTAVIWNITRLAAI